MELVGARLGQHLHLGAAVAAVLRREAVGHHANFGDRVDVRGYVDGAAAGNRVDALIIDREVVRFRPLAAGTNGGRRLSVVDVAAELPAGDPGLQRQQVVYVPPGCR